MSQLDLQRLAALRKRATDVIIEQQKSTAALDDDLISFSESEIEDILSVIPKPPTRIQDGDRMYQRQREIVANQLRKLKHKPNTIDYIKERTKEAFLRSWISPGTPYGLTVSDDFGASATQGALNTKRTAGAKQNAVGIKAQREIMFLSERSIPIVNIVFDELQTFNDIMESWRPKLVGIKLIDLIDDPRSDISIEKTKKEPWFDDFKVVNDKFVGYSNTLVVKIKLKNEKLFIYKVDLYESMKRLEAHKKGKSINAYTILYSPIFNEEVYLYIYPNDASIDIKNGVSTLADYKSSIIINEWMDILLNTTISGREGIRSITAIPHSLLDGLQEASVGEQVRISFNAKYKNLYGASPQMIVELLKSSNLVETYVIDGESVLIPKLKFNPSILKYRTKAASFSYTYNNVWTISATNSTILTLIMRILDSMKAVYIFKDDLITITKEPILNVVDEIKSLLAYDIEMRIEREEQLRAQRIESGSDTSIIVESSNLENAATLYTAEVLGGTLYQFATEMGVDINRSYSNSAKEINQLLGISAARNFLVHEIEDVWSRSGVPLQPHSIITMADAMSYRGSLTPSSHNGITSGSIGFLSKATVSAATRHISMAALNGERDYMQSASACLISGKIIKFGSGLPKVISMPVIEESSQMEQFYDEGEEGVEYIAMEEL